MQFTSFFDPAAIFCMCDTLGVKFLSCLCHHDVPADHTVEQSAYISDKINNSFYLQISVVTHK